MNADDQLRYYLDTMVVMGAQALISPKYGDSKSEVIRVYLKWVRERHGELYTARENGDATTELQGTPGDHNQ